MGTGYEPLDLPKPVAEDIWIVDGPAIRFYGMPFSTRATIVRLADGALWVHSPTRLTPALAERVEALGPVRHLVAPNWIHYACVADWQARFPEAEAWAAPGVAKRASKRGMTLHFDHQLTQDPPAGWAGEIDQMIVRGSEVHREAVFFHRASATLILTDLIENFEPRKLGFWMRLATRLGGIQAPRGSMPRDMRATFRDRAALREDVLRMIGWQPERVILAHGRWFERDGTAELERAFRWLL
ncbi:DUF4336 domain-containing protein [Sinisalibacter lacisalsi]|uniref:DUF4336 domain-containing protein n=1 Tax=Sinisalibacter lacisalsi TaxID=1526570 RepID=A0ABQ1QWG2_9RHOB|nr:DUF4336 domain-containing protein [Sinisalibacter lacisalsi]GGD47333.1 hypothetical protein GCM10011358_33940 [Sinisalibacter lacisalsi]